MFTMTYYSQPPTMGTGKMRTCGPTNG